jgi:hypothetical protein
MADGTYKPIEEIKTGDKVLATDPKTGITKAEPVVATIIGEGFKNLVEITIRTGSERPSSQVMSRGIPMERADSMTPLDGTSNGSLIAPEGHPFWVPELGKWIDAGQLQPNQWLQTSTGSWVQIAAVQAFTQGAGVRNLTVADTHTYHVSAGVAPVLVHNTNTNPQCPTKSTHYADVEIMDQGGNTRESYSFRSGNQEDEEAAMGKRRGAILSHTENRVGRRSGGPSVIGGNVVPNDPYSGMFLTGAGETVLITGTRRPCSNCKGAMNRAAKATGANFVYRWVNSGGGYSHWANR